MGNKASVPKPQKTRVVQVLPLIPPVPHTPINYPHVKCKKHKRRKMRDTNEKDEFAEFREWDLALQEGKKSGDIEGFQRSISEIMISGLSERESRIECCKLCIMFLREHERIDDHYFSTVILAYSYIRNGVLPDEMVSWLMIDEDDSWSQLLLSLMFDGNDIEGISLIYKSCLQGNAWSQMVLGNMYKECNDAVTAVKWLRKSVEQGNTLAQADLEECLKSNSPQRHNEFCKMASDIEKSYTNPRKRKRIRYIYSQTVEDYLDMKEDYEKVFLERIMECFDKDVYIPKDLVNIFVSYLT